MSKFGLVAICSRFFTFQFSDDARLVLELHRREHDARALIGRQFLIDGQWADVGGERLVLPARVLPALARTARGSARRGRRLSGLDALTSERLLKLLGLRDMPRKQLELLKVAEASEKQALYRAGR